MSWNHLPVDGIAHHGLDPPTLIINQEYALLAYLEANITEVFSQLGLPSLRWFYYPLYNYIFMSFENQLRTTYILQLYVYNTNTHGSHMFS